jgi:hypothetical protein
MSLSESVPRCPIDGLPTEGEFLDMCPGHKPRTRIDKVLDELQAAVVERRVEREKLWNGKDRRKYHHADGAKDGLLEAIRIVENIKGRPI